MKRALADDLPEVGAAVIGVGEGLRIFISASTPISSEMANVTGDLGRSDEILAALKRHGDRLGNITKKSTILVVPVPRQILRLVLS